MTLRLLTPLSVSTTETSTTAALDVATSPSVVQVTLHHYRIHESGRHAIRDDGRVTPLAEWGIDRATPGSEVWRCE